MQKPLNQSVSEKLSNYPDNVRRKFLEIRKILFDTAAENNVSDIEETLKWGEPAYLVKGGSTIRVDWKSKSPNTLYIFFNCNSVLVETFREVYFDVFKYQGNRAIELELSQPLPVEELKHCLLMALKYHSLKNLALLGAT